jgi:hypothetical protein
MRVRGQNTWLLTPKLFAITKALGKYWYASNMPRGHEAECIGQELRLRHLIVMMIISGKGPNAGPQISHFKL